MTTGPSMSIVGKPQWSTTDRSRYPPSHLNQPRCRYRNRVCLSYSRHVHHPLFHTYLGRLALQQPNLFVFHLLGKSCNHYNRFPMIV